MVAKEILIVAGTRADAIKLAPVVVQLRGDAELRTTFLVTGQHRELLDQALSAFGLRPDIDLEIMGRDVDLGVAMMLAFDGVRSAINAIRPDALVVQGDTTTSFAAALAAFYEQVPVAHVEAGLRTTDLGQPFPEEANRTLIRVMAGLHLAPTAGARANLLAEGARPDSVVITGNTGIDALHRVAQSDLGMSSNGISTLVEEAKKRRLVLITSHRRESWGEIERGIARAVARVAAAHPAVLFVVPLHPNPRVQEAMRPELDEIPNVRLRDPLPYPAMMHLLARAYGVATDSGGIQEEACALGIPTLVLRQVTERPEGVAEGVVRVIGADEERVELELGQLLRDDRLRARMATASGVFGDGRASERIHAAIRRFVGLAAEIDEFAPSGR